MTREEYYELMRRVGYSARQARKMTEYALLDYSSYYEASIHEGIPFNNGMPHEVRKARRSFYKQHQERRERLGISLFSEERLMSAHKKARQRVQFRFIWYDMWVGAFWDRHNKVLYIAPLPCCVFIIRRKTP